MAAPKIKPIDLVNEEGQPDVGGRPRKYATPELFEQKVIEYFDFVVANKMEISLNGLALYMGFYDKSGLKNYVDYEGFLPPLKRALSCVELSYELDLRTFKFGGAVFALKNMGWTDVTTQNVNQTINNVSANFGTTNTGNALQPSQEPKENT
jgi:hypothetical protein